MENGFANHFARGVLGALSGVSLRGRSVDLQSQLRGILAAVPIARGDR